MRDEQTRMQEAQDRLTRAAIRYGRAGRTRPTDKTRAAFERASNALCRAALMYAHVAYPPLPRRNKQR